MKPKLYLSGPMAGRDWNLVEEEFEKYEKLFSLLGFDVMNPCKFSHTDTEDRELTLKEDFRQLECTDFIFMLPGWSESKGCNAEWGYAIACGIKVLKSDHPAELSNVMNYLYSKNPKAIKLDKLYTETHIEKEIDEAMETIKKAKPYTCTIK
jgi:nucleoside 2-deoxyribosyltransferase